MTGFKDSLAGGNLIEGKHKQNSLHLSLKQSLKKDNISLDLICEVFYRHIIQFLTLTIVHKTSSIAVELLLCVSFSYKKYCMIRAQIHQRHCYEMTKHDVSSTPWCVPASSEAQGRTCYPLLPSKKVYALGEHWSSTRYELQGWTQRRMSLRARKQTLIVSK